MSKTKSTEVNKQTTGKPKGPELLQLCNFTVLISGQIVIYIHWQKPNTNQQSKWKPKGHDPIQLYSKVDLVFNRI